MVPNQNDTNLSDLSRKLSPSLKEFSVSKPKNVSRSINQQKENTTTSKNSFSVYSSQSTNSSSSSSETVSSASYLAIYERKTAEQVTLYDKLALKLKPLEESFELEKQRIVKEVMEAENKAVLAKLEAHFDSVLLSQTSNVPIKMSEDCSNKYHHHDKIRITQNQVNNNNIKKHNLNKTYQMNNLTDFINQNKNLTEINNSPLPDKIEFSPKSNYHH